MEKNIMLLESRKEFEKKADDDDDHHHDDIEMSKSKKHMYTSSRSRNKNKKSCQPCLMIISQGLIHAIYVCPMLMLHFNCLEIMHESSSYEISNCLVVIFGIREYHGLNDLSRILQDYKN